jgi:hypothetical protein
VRATRRTAGDVESKTVVAESERRLSRLSSVGRLAKKLVGGLVERMDPVQMTPKEDSE